MFSKIWGFFIDCINGRKYKGEVKYLSSYICGFEEKLKEREKEIEKLKDDLSRVETSKMAKDLERGVLHCKAVIDGKLYSTKTAERIGKIPSYVTKHEEKYSRYDDVYLFKTKNGNYFVCKLRKMETYMSPDEHLKRFMRYSDIEAVSIQEIKDTIGRDFPDLYIELFGEVEEA